MWYNAELIIENSKFLEGKGQCSMIPETVAYYHAMLMVGIRDKLDEAFDRALETEEPLSELVLSLSTCISDDEAVLSVLRNYLAEHTIDKKIVYHMIRGDFRQRCLTEQLPRAEVAELLYRIVMSLDKFSEDPWHQLTFPMYALEVRQEGLISEEVFNRCFDAWLFQGERLDVWQLQRDQTKK